MDGLLESFSSPCALCAREGFTVRACFDSFLFSPSSSPPRFVVAPQPPRFSLLAFFPFDMFHSLPSYSCSKGYSLNLNVFFSPLPWGEGMQDALRGLMITRRFDADRTMLVRMNISFDIGCEYWRERWNRGNESFESEYNSG